MQFIKTNDVIDISKGLLILELFYTQKCTEEYQKKILDYETKKYNFKVRNAIYEYSKIYDKKEQKYLCQKYPLLKNYIERSDVKNIKISMILNTQFLLESAMENKMISSFGTLQLTSLAITFNKEITNLEYFIPFANKKHEQKVYRWITNLCQICIYNDHNNMISATGIKTLNDAVLLRTMFEYFN
jgi:hypothetical protein